MKLEDQPRFRYWAFAVKHISRRIELSEPAYERSFEVQPFELSLRLPKRDNPIWRHAARVGLMFSLGAGVLFATSLIQIGVSASTMIVLIAILLPVAMLNIMRHYSLAIGCITAQLILVYQTMAHQGLDFAAPRLIDNVIGGAIVLLGYGLNGEAKRSIIKR